jgi:hypothetical protein
MVFVASQAWEMAHAIGITLFRLTVTRHRLLEWETAAASAERGGPPRARAFFAAMIASPAIAVTTTAWLAFVARPALPIALPILALWAGAPLIAFMLSRPVRRGRQTLDAVDREFLRLAARGHGNSSTPSGRRPRASARRRAGQCPTTDRTPDLTHEPRHAALLATLAAHDFDHRHRHARGPDRRDADDDGRARSALKVTC